MTGGSARRGRARREPGTPRRTGGERAIVVHSLDHARAAVSAAIELGVPVTLCSAPLAAAYAGAAYFRELVNRAQSEFPGASVTAVLDCGAEPGLALSALRAGIRAILFTGADPAAKRLDGIAEKLGGRVVRECGALLDLLDCEDPKKACLAWLASDARREPRRRR